MRRPEIGLEDILFLSDFPQGWDAETQETLEIEVKYAGYIELQRQEIERLRKMSGASIPSSLNFHDVSGLSHEIREKLQKLRPSTLAEASAIPGVTPAALTAMLFHLRQKETASA